MPIIESVRNFIATCPLLNDINTINVEFLPQEVGTFSIEAVPEQSVIETYINGDEQRQFTFVVASRFIYSDEAKQAIDNSGFFEDFVEWIEEQNEIGNYPILTGNKTATGIEVTTSGYLFNIASGMRDARYQVQMKLYYYVERN